MKYRRSFGHHRHVPGMAVHAQAQEAATALDATDRTSIPWSSPVSAAVSRRRSTPSATPPPTSKSSPPKTSAKLPASRRTWPTHCRAGAGRQHRLLQRQRRRLRRSRSRQVCAAPILKPTQTLVNGHPRGNRRLVRAQPGRQRRQRELPYPSEIVDRVVVHKTSEAKLVEVALPVRSTSSPGVRCSSPNRSRSEGLIGAVPDLPGDTKPQLDALLNWRNEERTAGLMVQVETTRRAQQPAPRWPEQAATARSQVRGGSSPRRLCP